MANAFFFACLLVNNPLLKREALVANGGHTCLYGNVVVQKDRCYEININMSNDNIYITLLDFQSANGVEVIDRLNCLHVPMHLCH